MRTGSHEHQCSNCAIEWPCHPGPDGCRIHHRDLCPQCAREVHDKIRERLKVAERQFGELRDSLRELIVYVPETVDACQCDKDGKCGYHKTRFKAKEVLESNGGRLGDALVPQCTGCETSANMEKTWRCKRCSPDKFDIKR